MLILLLLLLIIIIILIIMQIINMRPCVAFKVGAAIARAVICSRPSRGMGAGWEAGCETGHGTAMACVPSL